MVQLLIKINERDFDDFEKFAVLFLLEESNFDKFIDFAPEDWLPVVSEFDLRGELVMGFIFLIVG